MPGLYIHIPFCRSKCHYCDFTTSPDPAPDLIYEYFSALSSEAKKAKQLYGSLHFGTIYIGGGTPSWLSGEQMERLFEMVASNFSWSKDAEITCEVNPDDVTSVKMNKYKELGINRISLGAQSFDDVILTSIGRKHDVSSIRRAYDVIASAGFDNISLDVMIRLPGQTVDQVRQSVEACVELGAGQVVVYDLNVHEGTAFGRRQKQGRLPLPSESEHLEMDEAVAEILVKKNGYSHYEILSYAKPGFESRHNLNYWKNGAYLGLGPGAYSYMNGERYCFAGLLKSYVERCRMGDWAREESECLNATEREAETLLLGLRLSEGIDAAKFGRIADHLRVEVPPLVEKGLMNRAGDQLSLTPKGMRLAETVFTQLSLS